MGPNFNDGVFIRKGEDTEKKAMGRARQTLEGCSYKSKNTKNCWKPPEGRRRKRRILPKDPTETSSLQNCQRINFCRFEARHS